MRTIITKSFNGKDGIFAAEKIIPDAILLDIQLPEMDGYTVAKELRKIKVLENTLIIVVTSYARVGDKEKAMEAGANGYIEKPINPDTFISQLEGFISNKRRINT